MRMLSKLPRCSLPVRGLAQRTSARSRPNSARGRGCSRRPAAFSARSWPETGRRWMGSRAGRARPLTRRFGELSDRAERDALTGLANRRALDERLEEELDRARRYRTHLSLVLVDIDDFKQVNDRYGHQSGDDLLRAFATALSGSLRELDLAARFGGEEFALLLPGTPSGGACIVAEQIRRLVSELAVAGPGRLPIR